MKNLIHNKVYLDANIFIYAIEGLLEYTQLMKSLFNNISLGKINAVTSELTLSECLVKPFKENEINIINTYKQYIQSSFYLNVKAINRDILINAAEIRGQNKFLKLPDAIHLATAIAENCNYFLTNDKRIKANKIKIIYLNTLNSNH